VTADPSQTLFFYLEGSSDTDPPAARLVAGGTTNQNDSVKDIRNKLREWESVWNKASRHSGGGF
jgi:hypothetical protein